MNAPAIDVFCTKIELDLKEEIQWFQHEIGDRRLLGSAQVVAGMGLHQGLAQFGSKVAHISQAPFGANADLIHSCWSPPPFNVAKINVDAS